MQSTTRTVFENDRVSIGQYRCRPGSRLWDRENRVGDRAEIVFPRRSVSISQERKRKAVASPNEVVMYDAHTRYLRQPIDPRGDLCEVYAVEPGLMEEMVSRANLPASRSPEVTFREALAPCSSNDYLRQRSIFLYLSKEADPDPVFVEETVLAVMWSVLSGAAGFFRHQNTTPKKHTSGRSRELADSAADFVSRNHQNPLTLQDVASACGCSVFHLCRVFQANKGVSVYQYMLKFRLRSALGEVRDEKAGRVVLNRIASRYGFASHSHFTSSFCKQFGLTPSELRHLDFGSMLKKLAGP